MSTSNIGWYEVCDLSDIPVRGAVRLAHGEKTIAIFKSSTHGVHAIDDACPHKKGPLSDGIVHGNCVTCPLHNWKINLSSGQVEGADEGQVDTYNVKVKNQTVYVQLSEQCENTLA